MLITKDWLESCQTVKGAYTHAQVLYEKYKDVIDDMEIIPEPILQPLIFAIHYAAEKERCKVFECSY